MKLILTRHGHVDGISEPRFNGPTEVSLTVLGHEQAKAVGRRIADRWKPVKIYTSPRNRSVETATEIAASCRSSVEQLEALNDLDYGEWSWRTYDEIRDRFGESFAAWRKAPQLVRFPGGESLQDLVARTADALRLAYDRHASETVVFVGHDSVNRALLLQLLDQPLSSYWRLAQSPCCINEIDFETGNIQVLRINESLHLEGISLLN